MHGLLVIDKPAGITSRDAVDRAQRWLPRGTRLGHTGTLDPLATGVLVLCVGNATRLAEYVQRMAKTYRAGIVLGARSDTDDEDGTVTESPNVTAPPSPHVAEHLNAFVGAIEQVPPAFSAAKVNGRRAYDLARQGRDVSLSARTVTIYAVDVLRYEYPVLELEVRCSKGTYIRSLARDLGERLGCGGYIQALRRTRVGCFDAAAALTLDADAESARRALLPLARAVSELPTVHLAPAEVTRVRQGQAIALPPLEGKMEEVALLDGNGELVAVGSIDRQRRCIRPGKVLS
jgi:tRNA pseudouridine55 synthase